MIPVVHFRIVDTSEAHILFMDVDYREVVRIEFASREQAESGEWALRRAFVSGLKTGLDVGMTLATKRES